jgi:hypothetical protein
LGGEQSQDRFVKSPANDFDLSPGDKTSQKGDVVGIMLLDPLDQGASQVVGDMDVGKVLQKLQKRPVAILLGLSKDMIEVSRGLMVMEDHHHGCPGIFGKD